MEKDPTNSEALAKVNDINPLKGAKEDAEHLIASGNFHGAIERLSPLIEVLADLLVQLLKML